MLEKHVNLADVCKEAKRQCREKIVNAKVQRKIKEQRATSSELTIIHTTQQIVL